MLATLASPSSVAREGDWAFEMKWDGVRVLVGLDHGTVTLRGRRGRDETARYPDLIAGLAALPCDAAILDGEIVVLDPGGAPSFGLLQPRINLTRAADIAAAAVSAPAQVMLFDVLSLNGRSVRDQPYEVRRKLLEALDPPAGSRVRVPAAFDGDLAAALDASAAFRLEGVVAKRRGAPYEPGRRSSAWLKIKHRQTQAVVVGGWRAGQGNRSGTVGALLLGIPGPAGLAFVGRVGSGFTDAALAEVRRRLDGLARATTPFVDVPREDAKDSHWVEPHLVAEVSFTERTLTDRLRAPVWHGWRPDLAPSEVEWES